MALKIAKREKDLCIRCNELPVSVWKWGLCVKCYSYAYYHKEPMTPYLGGRPATVSLKILEFDNELTRILPVKDEMTQVWSATQVVRLLGIKDRSAWVTYRMSKYKLRYNIDYVTVQHSKAGLGRDVVSYYFTTPAMKKLSQSYGVRGEAILAEAKRECTSLDDTLQRLAQIAQNYGSVGAELWEVVAKAGELLTKEDCYAPLGVDRPELQDVVKKSWWRCLWRDITAAWFKKATGVNHGNSRSIGAPVER